MSPPNPPLEYGFIICRSLRMISFEYRTQVLKMRQGFGILPQEPPAPIVHRGASTTGPTAETPPVARMKWVVWAVVVVDVAVRSIGVRMTRAAGWVHFELVWKKAEVIRLERTIVEVEIEIEMVGIVHHVDGSGAV